MTRHPCFARAAFLSAAFLAAHAAAEKPFPAAAQHRSEPALPTAAQVAWADLEHGQFMHCNHPGDIAAMAYPNFDAGKFADCALSQGARYIVFVAKHGDGFCWWQTATTGHSIKSAKWKGGKGDVFGEVVQACRARGLKAGFYLSPADEHFGARVSGIAVDAAKQDAYNDYYCAQLTELCTRYGPMVEIWFDGALYPVLRGRVKEVILKHQPDACTFQGPVNTIRWVGNESGAPPAPAWNAISKAAYQAMLAGSYATCSAGDPRGVFWSPNECDTTLSTDWFGGGMRPLPELLRCYYNSVGSGAQLLMNVSPNPDGSISPENVKRAAELGSAIRGAVGHPLCSTSGRGPSLTLDLEGNREIDHVVLQEDIGKGERVLQYTIEGLADGKWRQIAEGTAIGHKRIHKIAPASFSQVRLTVAKSQDLPLIRKLYVTRTGQTVRDTTPPSAPPRLVGRVVDANRIDLTWTAASDPESGIIKYKVFRNGQAIGESRAPGYSDRDLCGSTTYTYRVLAVNGAGMESAMSNAVSSATPVDVRGPTIVSIQQRALTTLDVVFSKSVEQASAENAANYRMSDGVSISAAALGPDLKTVTLTTSPMKEFSVCTLTINNVRDRAQTPNVILPGSTARLKCTNALVRYFKLDEGRGTAAVDFLGGAKGSILGVAQWEQEQGASQLRFDGTSTAVDIGPPTALEGNFTFAAWIKPNAAGKGEREIVAQDRSGCGDYQFRLALGPDNTLGFVMTNETGGDFGLGVLSTSATVPNGVWTHVAVTRSADTFCIYVDGKQAAERTTSGHVTQPYNPVTMLIGARFAGDATTPCDCFRGLIREFRVYKRPLSAAELSEIASSGSVSQQRRP
jgi:alpha-L-fucosidase